jgi:hypothetical protein
MYGHFLTADPGRDDQGKDSNRISNPAKIKNMSGTPAELFFSDPKKAGRLNKNKIKKIEKPGRGLEIGLELAFSKNTKRGSAER